MFAVIGLRGQCHCRLQGLVEHSLKFFFLLMHQVTRGLKNLPPIDEKLLVKYFSTHVFLETILGSTNRAKCTNAHGFYVTCRLHLPNHCTKCYFELKGFLFVVKDVFSPANSSALFRH